MADQDTAAPIPRRRRADFNSQADRSLLGAILLLGARQLVDVWLSVLTLAGIFVLMIVLVAASLSSRYHWPPQIYSAISIAGLVLSFIGLVGARVVWLVAHRRARAIDG